MTETLKETDGTFKKGEMKRIGDRSRNEVASI